VGLVRAYMERLYFVTPRLVWRLRPRAPKREAGKAKRAQPLKGKPEIGKSKSENRKSQIQNQKSKSRQSAGTGLARQVPGIPNPETDVAAAFRRPSVGLKADATPTDSSRARQVPGIPNPETDVAAAFRRPGVGLKADATPTDSSPARQIPGGPNPSTVGVVGGFCLPRAGFGDAIAAACRRRHTPRPG
jgi:hypothetical protein